MALLEVRDLNVSFQTNSGPVFAVRGIGFDLDRGETLAIIGESGSGKSQAVFAMLGLLDANGRCQGEVRFDGTDILNAPSKILNPIRTNRMAIIFQDPMTSLNPYMRISEQMAEVLTLHKGFSKREALAQSIAMLDAVKIPDAKSRLNRYPHEFSGGMRQRVMIAMALLCRPDILIADEPTTALDVTIQAQIMALLRELQRDFGMGVILITHDMGVVAGAAERTIVMYGGQVMEEGPTDAIFKDATHPYTRALLASIPRVDQPEKDLRSIPGNPPNMMQAEQGCPFAPRCDFATTGCLGSAIALKPFAPNRLRACNRAISEVQ